MADDNQMLSPTSGSVLAQLTPLGLGPGIQAWYDEWIQPDPTKQIGGVPTRLVFGLEEIFENRTPTPQDGRSDFKAIGPYNANGGACLLVLASSACSDKQQADPNNTTTHPDQHAGTFIPDGKGGVTLVAGNDGGNYRQHVTGGPASRPRAFNPIAMNRAMSFGSVAGFFARAVAAPRRPSVCDGSCCFGVGGSIALVRATLVPRLRSWRGSRASRPS